MAHFLPITLEEVKRLGWETLDIVIISGDAYIDHPSFGTAVIGRTLEAAGYRVGIIPQPNWRDDLRDFRKFGRPRLFFGITSGVMDSMVNHYTAAKRLRHDDAYTPGGAYGFRPDYATYVYCRKVKEVYPDVPVVIGGIEASMRRLAHYDYWSDTLKPSILEECPADLLVYGMGERPIVEIARMLDQGARIEELHTLQQIAYRSDKASAEQELKGAKEVVWLHSYDACKRSKRCQAENFHKIEEESNRMEPAIVVQVKGESCVVVKAPYPTPTTAEMDATYALPYLRQPHPKYKKRGTIPAFEMIKNSINTHRGCFGGCAFCTISAHQGKQIAWRSENSIIEEAKRMAESEGFNGVITDLGGPSANMYGMRGRDTELCRRCKRYSCIYPTICKNLECDHGRIVELYKKVVSLKGVKHVYIGSGIRCDLFTEDNGGWEYFSEVVRHHVSGRLKVAPEHTEKKVLGLMRKPTFDLFERTKKRFDDICRESGLRYQLIPYFISSHPGCNIADMARLAAKMRQMGYRLEQIQDFTPTPMTLATEMYYTGLDPDTMEAVYVAQSAEEKKEQNLLFFSYKKENRAVIERVLRKAHIDPRGILW